MSGGVRVVCDRGFRAECDGTVSVKKGDWPRSYRVDEAPVARLRRHGFHATPSYDGRDACETLGVGLFVPRAPSLCPGPCPEYV